MIESASYYHVRKKECVRTRINELAGVTGLSGPELLGR